MKHVCIYALGVLSKLEWQVLIWKMKKKNEKKHANKVENRKHWKS